MDKNDCPCWGCVRRPNCKGCEEFNSYRQRKQKEADQRYVNNAFNRYEADLIQSRIAKKAERSKKKNMRWSNQK
ncbi:MAG: hypothetical protein IKU47_03480 [Oscillospiraceae bacterium]|nr:hypothetical protein [Oscillospiraceae bacterium]